MRSLVKTLIFLTLLGGLGTGIYFPATAYIRQRNKPVYQFQEAVRGDLTYYVNATGKVDPVMRVTVGAVVSGPIQKLYADFNDKVTEGQLMAKIDPRIYASVVLRDEALLEMRLAEVQRAEARLQQAVNAEQRALELLRQGTNFISESEVDEMKFNRLAAEAELSVAQTAVRQAEANLANSRANLEYTDIRSPVDGIVVDRKIDEGQTLAAQFQTPELFVVAPQMDERMYIYASVDEADIGLIRRAQAAGNPVQFTVDAYPDEVFDTGAIEEIRLSSQVEQNVVTYPVVVSTLNPCGKLLPGMTASLSFRIEHHPDVIKIPNAALRFYPPDRKKVHPDDRAILDGVETAKQESQQQAQASMSALERAAASRKKTLRHVWYFDGEFLRAKEVVVGLSDSRYTELIEGDVAPGDRLVTGEQPKQ